MSGVRAPYRATSFCFSRILNLGSLFQKYYLTLSTLSFMPLATRGPYPFAVVLDLHILSLFMLRSGVAAGLRLFFMIPTFIFCAD
ncbi:hypothetical protein BDV24DRAFT_135787 [Aspergillus arachidicola]|uniref:Uncharacterized protein n=1 Tax=Aspergillus arachidicola TaxID=656916 RepID=A0A5N6Y279_9EURO|nr:hypothetical protein BDV24DRAFT_135787 [Aspergillus arachidicola]